MYIYIYTHQDVNYVTHFYGLGNFRELCGANEEERFVEVNCAKSLKVH